MTRPDDAPAPPEAERSAPMDALAEAEGPAPTDARVEDPAPEAPGPARPAEPSRPRWLRIVRLEFLDIIVDAMGAWLLWAIVIGVSPGLALWAPLHRTEPKFVLEDIAKHLIHVDLSLDERLQLIEWGVISLMAMSVVYALLGVLHHRRRTGVPLSRYFARLNVKLIPVAMLPLVSALVTEQLEARLHLLTLAITVIAAVAMGYWWYQRVSERALTWRDRLAHLERRYVPELLMVMLVAGYTWMFGYLSVTDHHNLGTHIYDLALYDNTFWNTVNGDTMACSYLRGNTHYSAHFDPIIILLSPIYALNPRAETLLWLQSAWLAMGGIPLYLHAKRTLGNPWQALVVVTLFLLAPALHGINMFDFHSLALMVPLVMWMVYLLDVGTPAALVGYWVVLALLLLTREDMPFVACSISLYAVATRRRLTGVMTVLVAFAYLVEIKSGSRALLSGDEESYSYSYYYEELIPKSEDGTDEGLMGLVATTLSDPLAALAVLLKPNKLIYFGKVLLPLLLLPLFAGKKRLLLLYGLAFIGLVSRKYVFSVHFQYSSVLLPFLLMAWPDGLANVTGSPRVTRLGIDPRRLRTTLLFAAIIATLVITSKFGAIVPNKEFHAGWNRLQRTHNDERAERYQHMWDFIDQVPGEASICSNSIIGPHVSNRPEVYKWPSCRKADYVLMGNEKLKKKDRRRLDRLKARHDYEVVDESKQFMLLRKLPKEEADEARKAKRAAKRRETTSKRKRPAPEAADRDDEDAESEGADNPYRDGDDESASAAARRRAAAKRPQPGDRGRKGEDEDEGEGE